MKRVLIIVAVGIAMFSMLCVGLALGVLFSPVKAEVNRVIDRFLNRAETRLQIEPRFQSREFDMPLYQAEEGILIAGVIPDSPAEKSGLRRGDILLSVDGNAVNQLIELQTLLQTYQPGDAVEIVVKRGDRELSLSATLETSPESLSPEGEPVIYLGILSDWGIHGLPPGAFSFDFHPGVRILEVLPDSPAEQAGLEAGQLITAIDGKELAQMTDLASALAEYKPGDRVELTVVQSDDEDQIVIVRLGENPDRTGAAWLGIRMGPPALLNPQDQMPWMPEGGEGQPDMPHRWFGRMPENVLPFSEATQPGALIREVVEDSPAENAGLQPGQLIQAVDGKPLDDPSTLPDILANHNPGDSVTLTVFDPTSDSEKSSEVEVTLGENPDQPGSAWLGIRFVYLNLKRFTPEALPEG